MELHVEIRVKLHMGGTRSSTHNKVPSRVTTFTVRSGWARCLVAAPLSSLPCFPKLPQPPSIPRT